MFGEFPATQMLQKLAEANLLPAILFRSARKQCDADVERIAHSRSARLPTAQQNALREAVQVVLDKYNFEPEVVLGHPHYEALITSGVGAHHAGQLLVWRILLEELMTRSMLRMMVATGTVAAGVDFPARTVIVTAHSKRGAEGFNVLTSSEFQQMSGRAGRRGKDAVGICVVAPGPYSDARVIHELTKKPPEPLRSAYFAAPSTVLNLLKYRSADELRYTVSKSLAAFLDRKAAYAIREDVMLEEARLSEDDSLSKEARKKAEKRVRRKLREVEILERRQETLLEESLQGLTRLGYIESGTLTDKGSWAAELCTSLVLHLGEAIQDGLFEDLTVEQLAAMVSTIAGDPHRPYFSLRPNILPREQLEAMRVIVERVRTQYTTHGMSEVEVVPDAAVTVVSWMEAANWPEFAGYLRLAGVAEGDVSRLVTQTADHLNQIARLTQSHPTLAAAAEEARRRLLKPPLSEATVAD